MIQALQTAPGSWDPAEKVVVLAASISYFFYGPFLNFALRTPMKNYLRLAFVSLSLSSLSYAAPFMAIGSGAELFLTGTLGVRVDDNIFLERNGRDDVIFDINPGVELTFGKNAQVKGALTVSHNFASYADNSNLNTNLLQADFVSKYDDAKTKLGFNAGFHELNQNAPDIRGLTRRDVTTIGGNAEVEVSQKMSVGSGVAFLHENYKRRNYDDADELTVPLDLYFEMTPKLDLSAGYRYRDREITGVGADSTDHFFNFGARGDFSPKLTGVFKVGYASRKLSSTAATPTAPATRSRDENLLGLDASFAWELSSKSSLQIAASNDFGVTPQGDQQENLTFNASLTTKLTTEWMVNGGFSYRQIAYANRDDDFWEFSLGTNYVVNSNVRLTAGYTRRDYSTDNRLFAGSEFKNNVFNVSASLRY